MADIMEFNILSPNYICVDYIQLSKIELPFNIPACSYTYARTYTYTNIPPYVQASIHTYTYLYIDTHIYIQRVSPITLSHQTNKLRKQNGERSPLTPEVPQARGRADQFISLLSLLHTCDSVFRFCLYRKIRNTLTLTRNTYPYTYIHSYVQAYIYMQSCYAALGIWFSVLSISQNQGHLDPDTQSCRATVCLYRKTRNTSTRTSGLI